MIKRIEHQNFNTDLYTDLKKIANQLRKVALDMIYEAKSGHPGGSLSAADIVAVLYFYFMNINTKEPQWEHRDRFILSKGHACPIWYAALGELGYFDKKYYKELRKIGSILQGHPDMKKTPGVDMTTGSLGSGLGAGVGMAWTAKFRKKTYNTYVMIGCGEMDEGLIWESAMAAAKFKLDNLIVVSDYNQLQLDGTNNEVMPLEPIEDKWRSFNWHVQRINGHDIEMIIDAFTMAIKTKHKPSIIIAETKKGCGVSYMENVCGWHGKVPDEKQYQQALKELQV